MIKPPQTLVKLGLMHLTAPFQDSSVKESARIIVLNNTGLSQQLPKAAANTRIIMKSTMPQREPLIASSTLLHQDLTLRRQMNRRLPSMLFTLSMVTNLMASVLGPCKSEKQKEPKNSALLWLVLLHLPCLFIDTSHLFAQHVIFKNQHIEMG